MLVPIEPDVIAPINFRQGDETCGHGDGDAPGSDAAPQEVDRYP